jgi:hypothetical protein
MISKLIELLFKHTLDIAPPKIVLELTLHIKQNLEKF